MLSESYRILGVGENASDDQISDAYFRLRTKYSEERFMEGAKGNTAAEMLSKIDAAYEEIKAARAEKLSFEKTGSQYGEVDSLLKAGNISAAQLKLDNMSVRDAEWYYFQSIIFYRKKWYTESKKQLEFAMNMDPSNQKYKDAYEKMTRPQADPAFSGGQNQNYNQNNYNQGNQNQNYNRRQMGGSDCDSCAECCMYAMCLNCLCGSCR